MNRTNLETLNSFDFVSPPIVTLSLESINAGAKKIRNNYMFGEKY